MGWKLPLNQVFTLSQAFKEKFLLPCKPIVTNLSWPIIIKVKFSLLLIKNLLYFFLETFEN